MIDFVKKRLLYSLAVAFFVLSAVPLQASEYSVRPFIIDKTAGPRDVITEMVTLTNDSEYRKYVVFATVNEISVDSLGEIKEFVSPVMSDRTNTVTSWIEVTRGRIEIPPGETKEIPLTLRINPFVTPGEYYAFVGFVPAPNRPAAENISLEGEADGVIVKVTIADQREDSMKISGFLVNRFITDDTKREVDVVIENTGDLPSAPVGEIIFYDSRGTEVDSTPFNEDKVTVPPGEKVTIKSLVPVDEKLGRFKANISLTYGENQKASLFDTASFYLMPIHLLLLILSVIFIVVVSLFLLLRRTFVSDSEENEDGDFVTMYVKEGHDAKPQDHDINLKHDKE